ncbi:MAG: YggS family pyridoxal phosphate-dependent enzyme [Thermovirgaceae bacterium]|nr:YggS family pyridoxal phosphate-dependent enzyme [Thermovirgaceae bacterium]
MVIRIRENILKIRERIENAALHTGRRGEDVRLVAVTKTRSVEEMLEVCRCRVDALGENRVQEALSKISSWPADNGVPWHLIGHLQSNKARKAIEAFRCIQSVDSSSLARNLQNICSPIGRTLEVMAEVNIGDDANKFGVLAKDLPALVETILSECPSLSLSGFMTILPMGLDESAARTLFAGLRDLRNAMEIRSGRSFRELSMGMSGDFEFAVMEGSTMVRIGSAIFGERNY